MLADIYYPLFIVCFKQLWDYLPIFCPCSLSSNYVNMTYEVFIRFSDPAIDQMAHPHQKFVGYDEEASALHQRLGMIS